MATGLLLIIGGILLFLIAIGVIVGLICFILHLTKKK